MTTFLILWLAGSVTCYLFARSWWRQDKIMWTVQNRKIWIILSAITTWVGVLFVYIAMLITEEVEREKAEW